MDKQHDIELHSYRWFAHVCVYVSSCLHRYIAREGGGCGGIAYIRSWLVGHVPCCSQAFQCVCGQPGAASVKISEVPVKPQDTGVGSEDSAALGRMSNMLWLCCCSRAVPILQCGKGWSCSRCHGTWDSSHGEVEWLHTAELNLYIVKDSVLWFQNRRLGSLQPLKKYQLDPKTKWSGPISVVVGDLFYSKGASKGPFVGPLVWKDKLHFLSYYVLWYSNFRSFVLRKQVNLKQIYRLYQIFWFKRCFCSDFLLLNNSCCMRPSTWVKAGTWSCDQSKVERTLRKSQSYVSRWTFHLCFGLPGLKPSHGLWWWCGRHPDKVFFEFTGQNNSLFGQTTFVTLSGSIARWDKQMRFLKVPAQQDHQPPVASKIDIAAIVSFMIVRIIMALLMTIIIQSDHCAWWQWR